MRHEIDSYFEPDISWLGEINRQTLRLEREASVFPPGRTHHNCGAQLEPARASSPRTKREAARAIDRHLTELYNFVRREIATRQALGDLKAGDLTPAQVLDEAAARALEGFDSRPAELELSRWLY